MPLAGPFPGEAIVTDGLHGGSTPRAFREGLAYTALVYRVFPGRIATEDAEGDTTSAEVRPGY